MKKAHRLLLVAFLITAKQLCFAQDKVRILFIVDASLSMQSQWKGGTKWQNATEALSHIADSLTKVGNVEMGLRVLGHLYQQPDKNCHDSRLEVPIDTYGVKRIRKVLDEIHPKGVTPLVYAMEKGAEDFGDLPGKRIMIVITDGEDACDRDPCSITATLLSHNVVLQPYIIGMALQDESLESLKCMGKLYNTKSAAEFTSVLDNVVMESMAKTTLQVNLNDAAGNPTETDVNMTFYDTRTGLPKYNFYHSLNARGLPDTLIISPGSTYKIQLGTIPPVFADNVQLKENEHNIISINAPQGYLNLTLQGTTSKAAAVDRIKCLIHQSGEEAIVNVQKMNAKEKYITGSYDLEVLTLPRTIVRDVKVSQSKTTEVQIPAPGILTLNKTFDVYGGIFMIEDKRMKKIYDLRLKDKQETLTLQPGQYRIVYRSKSARTIHTTVDKEFEITSAGSLSLKL